MADLYEDWWRQAPAEKKAELRGLYLASLTNVGHERDQAGRAPPAAPGRGDPAGRRRWSRSAWSKDLVTLDPSNGDAHYVLAAEELEATSPEPRRDPPPPRPSSRPRPPAGPATDWIAARLAGLASDKARLEQVLARARAADPARPTPTRSTGWRCSGSGSSTSRTTADPADLAGQVEAVAREALAAAGRARDPLDPDRPDQPADRGGPAAA